MARSQRQKPLHRGALSVSADGPQLKDGYTRIENELLEKLLLAGLSGREWSVILVVLRKTNGFNKASDDIGLSQFRKMAGIANSHASPVVNGLVAKRILIRREGVHGNNLAVNKMPTEWVLPNREQLPDREQLPNREGGVPKTVTAPITESVIEGLPNREPQNTLLKKRKTTPKDTGAFAQFWSAYPKRKNKLRASAEFSKINPDGELLAEILRAVEAAKASPSWRKNGGEFIPLPSTWLHNRRWTDELEPQVYDALELEVINAYNEQMPASWPRAERQPYLPNRASDIREFVALAPARPEMPRRYFAHCAEKIEPLDGRGFDWLIRSDTYTRVKEGSLRERKEAA